MYKILLRVRTLRKQKQILNEPINFPSRIDFLHDSIVLTGISIYSHFLKRQPTHTHTHTSNIKPQLQTIHDHTTYFITT